MYLIEIDGETGYVKESPSNSGWKAISAFRNLKSIKELTVVALTCDYLSPIRHYKEDDRFERAMEEVYGDRSLLSKDLDRIKEAISVYDSLQYNSDLEFIEINKNIKNSLVDRLRDASADNNDNEINNLIKLINNNRDMMSKFMDSFDKEESINNSITENGYELSRIERDIITRKNNKFTNNAKDLKNPSKLKI